MKCANCDADALYLYNPPALRPTAYCPVHLPSFLRASAKAGLLQVTGNFEKVKEETFAILAPTVEPPAPEEAPKPPAPKRRRAKKVETVEEPAEDS